VQLLGVWLVCAVIFSFYFTWFFSTQISLAEVINGRLAISDLAYHLVMSVGFWFEGAAHIYSPDEQLVVLRGHFSPQINEAMPIGVSPIGLMIWFPFAVIARSDLAAASGVWTGISLATLVAALLHVISKSEDRLRWSWVLLIACTVFSSAARMSLFQTTPLAAGILLLLMSVDRNERSVMAFAAALVLLCIKPPYAIVGAGILAARKEWRALFVGLAACVGIAGVLFPYAGSDFYAEYITSLRVYTADRVPAVYASSIALSTMNLFSTAFEPSLGRSVSNLTSLLVYTLGSLTVCLAAMLGRVFPKMDGALAGSALIGIFLLFAPYAGAYEDLLLFPIAALVVLATTENVNRRGEVSRIIVLCLALNVLLNQRALPLPKAAALLWTMKAFFIALVIVNLRPHLLREQQ